MGKILKLLVIVVFSFSCVSVEPEVVSNSSLIIRSGQSFGFCVGKCYSEIEINANNVTLLVKERDIRGSSTLDKVYVYKDTFSTETTNSINSEINLVIFDKLNDIYGCPDCADGGSEWIEIEKNNGIKKRVTFEFGKTVPGIEKNILKLRTERQAMYKKFIPN